MLLIGAHQSISGGLDKAVLQSAETGCSTIQIFVRSNMAWNPGKLSLNAVKMYLNALKSTLIRPVVAHNCYLVNLASTDPVTLQRSLEATTGELERAEVLGIPYLVMHPGAHLGAGVGPGLKKVAKGIDSAISASKSQNVRILLENTAGAGTVLGSRFEQLAELISQSRFASRLGLCFDTCHAFAAGYDLRTPDGLADTLREFERNLSIDKLLCFHFNDALYDLGSRRDRHDHIGRGKIGETAFAQLLADKRFASVPKILETPKGLHRGKPWDVVNLDTLRRLAGESR